MAKKKVEPYEATLPLEPEGFTGLESVTKQQAKEIAEEATALLIGTEESE